MAANTGRTDRLGKGTWTSDHDYARDAWINDMITEAKGQADDLLAKIRKGAA